MMMFPKTRLNGSKDHEETGWHARQPARRFVEVGSVPKIERPVPAFRDANYANYTWSPIDPSSAARLALLDEDSRRGYEKLGYMPDPSTVSHWASSRWMSTERRCVRGDPRNRRGGLFGILRISRRYSPGAGQG